MKKNILVANNDILIKLIIPFSVFAGIFVFSKHQIGGYLCVDCFANSYEKIAVDIIAIIFFIGLIGLSYLIKRKNKEWKILYTLLIMILFLTIFYSVMAIGETFYVSDGGF